VDLLEPAVARVRRLETAAADALAPAEEVRVDGWRLRFNHGVTRRGNSALPEARGRRSLARKLREVRGYYAARGTAARLQLSSASRPAGLDAALEARGWRYEEGARVLTRAPSDPPPDGGLATDAAGGDVLVAAEPDDAYREVQAAVTPRAADWADARSRVLQEAGLRPWHLVLTGAGGRPVAAGLIVVDPNARLAGLFSLATRPEARRRGHATRLIRAALERCRVDGVATAYLQVAGGNDAALRLYGRVGFREHHRYHYRRWDDAGA
jgi:ribosomal protein S18 acetylase RimI-like enzyme